MILLLYKVWIKWKAEFKGYWGYCKSISNWKWKQLWKDFLIIAYVLAVHVCMCVCVCVCVCGYIMELLL